MSCSSFAFPCLTRSCLSVSYIPVLSLTYPPPRSNLLNFSRLHSALMIVPFPIPCKRSPLLHPLLMPLLSLAFWLSLSLTIHPSSSCIQQTVLLIVNQNSLRGDHCQDNPCPLLVRQLLALLSCLSPPYITTAGRLILRHGEPAA
jgi:hypothetical protein